MSTPTSSQAPNSGRRLLAFDRPDSPSWAGSEPEANRFGSDFGTDEPPLTPEGSCDEERMTKPKRAKRKKKKADGRASPEEENPAVDPIRYKTKMCRNWEQFEKCPYGPRCLFAHGKREMRSYATNHSAISTAAGTGSPERNFYQFGHFPSFVPVPWDLMNDELDQEQARTQPPPQRPSHPHGQPHTNPHHQPAHQNAAPPAPGSYTNPESYLPPHLQQAQHPTHNNFVPVHLHQQPQHGSFFPINLGFDPNITMSQHSSTPSLSCSIIAH